MASSTPVQDAVPFLTDAAHLLRASAPETSAHIMRHCADLLQNNNLPLPETHCQHSCGSCGQIMVPGDDASSIQLHRASKRVKGRRGSATKQSHSSASTSGTLRKRVSCGRCGRTKSIKMDNAPKAARRRRQKTKAIVEAAAPAPEETTSLKNKSNSNSKKRAKSRKAGLQSLLAAGQNQKSKSLSLSDFMK